MDLNAVLARRLIISIPTLAGIALAVFLVLLVMPGNPADLIQGEMVNPVVTRSLVHKWGLDEPPVERFLRWSASLLRGDLGTSLVTGRPVLEMLGSRFASSLYLGLMGVTVGIILGIPAGIVSAVSPNSLSDYATMTIALAGLSLPTFVTALIFQLGFAFRFRWFPISGAGDSPLTLEMLHHAVLPAISVGLYQAAINARLVRTSMLEVLGQDYIQTARAKGLTRLRTIVRHGLPNVLIPVVTLLGVYLRTVISGLLLVEIVFGWPGVGRLFFDAVRQRDYPVIQGVALAIAVGVYIVNLLVDLVYAYLDPRVRVEGAS